VFDSTGRAVYAHLALDSSFRLGLATAVSTDGGVTWKAGKLRLPSPDGNDKEFLAVGPDINNPGQERFYLAWHNFNVIYASSSADGLTWTKPVKVSDGSAFAGSGIAAMPAVGPNGELYIVWDDFGTTGVCHVMFDRSFDGGKTWGTDQEIATTNV